MSALESIVCERCGSSEFLEGDDAFVCYYCRAVFRKEKEDKASQTTIDMHGDVERLLKRCRLDPANASRYASLVLDIDPTNKQAAKYL